MNEFEKDSVRVWMLGKREKIWDFLVSFISESSLGEF